MSRWLLLALAACAAPPSHPLPGASITPHLARRTAPVACGVDIAVDGSTTPVLRFANTYDPFGRLVLATGTYTTGGPEDLVSYAYDHLGHLTHALETRSWGDAQLETVATFDTLGDLLDYSWTESGGPGEHYVFGGFDDAGQPTTEVYSTTGQPDVHIMLAYDAFERIATVVQDGGLTTTYTYDDDGRTLTVDTGGGEWHGVVEYDDQDRELSESWDGTATSVLANETVYDYSADRLLSMTYRSGSSAARHVLATREVDTYRYDCP